MPLILPWLRKKIGDLFGIDVRTLALFRIVMGLIILIDVMNRSVDLTTFYSDAGVFPRMLVMNAPGAPWRICIHAMSGAVMMQAFLFLIHAACAVGLLLGFRTRLVTFLCWIFAISLHTRNPLIERGGEVYLSLCLLWSLFLPLGAQFSIDSATNSSGEKMPPRICSWGTAAILIQTFIVYWFAGLYKMRGQAWLPQGDALYRTLMLDAMAHGPAPLLLLFPGLLKFLTRVTAWFECMAPWLLFCPVFTETIRIILLPCFWSFQLGIALCLKLAPFPRVCGMAMLVFVPASFWDKVGQFPAFTQNLSLYFTGLLERLPRRPLKVQLSRVENACAAALLLLYVFWNIADFIPSRVKMPKALIPICLMTNMDHRWNAYAPEPPRSSGWFVLPGILKDGTVVDLYKGGAPLSWAKPPYVSETFKDQCWQRYMTSLPGARMEWKREYGRYQCQEWNAQHPGSKQLVSFTTTVVERTTLENYKIQVPRRRELLEYSCLSGLQDPIGIYAEKQSSFKAHPPQTIMASPYEP